MKLPVYGFSFCLTAAAITLATIAFLPDAFSGALAQQEQTLTAPADASSTYNIPVYEPAPVAPTIVLQRNPFISDNAGALSPTDPTQASNPQAFAPEPGVAAPTPPGEGVPQAQPPSAAQAAPEQQDAVLGVVVGARAFALVNERGTTRIVSAGDSFEGHRVTRVTANGIILSNGSHAGIPLPE